MYPSVIQTFSYPTPSDRLNNPSHSALHNTTSSTIGQMQTFIGTESSFVGTLMYDIRSPLSNGGGHIQAVNKGGTGQTSYAKGDLLIASSASVLSKFAVSSTAGEVLTADPNQAVGVKWSPIALNKVAINTSSVIVSGSILQTLYAASVAGSTLGTNSAIKFSGALQKIGHQNDFTLALIYGNNTLATTTVVSVDGASVMTGEITGTIAAVNNSSVQQVGYFNLNALNSRAGNTGPIVHAFQSGTSSVNSSAPQELRITMQYAAANGLNSVMGGLFVVEKIQ